MKRTSQNSAAEQLIVARFSPFKNKTAQEINHMLHLGANPKAKGFYDKITKGITGRENLRTRTVRIEAKNQLAESVSFPAFEYKELVNEEWETSELKKELETRRLFVFYRLEGYQYVLDSAKWWTMPEQDTAQAIPVWEKTKSIVQSGTIVKKIEASGRRRTNFPDTRFNKVCHARPHGQNKLNTSQLPVPDRLTTLTAYSKYSFWLDRRYIMEKIYR